MLTLRQRIFIISGIVMGIVAGILLFLLFRPDKNVDNTSSQGNTQTTDSTLLPNIIIPSATNRVELPALPSIPPEELYVQQLSRIFVERFLSYSNQNRNQHIADIESLVTQKMLAWANSQQLIQEIAYTGVTTEVLSASTIGFGVTIAEVGIEIRQTNYSDENGALVQSSVQRSGRVQLEKVGDDWKVDALYLD